MIATIEPVIAFIESVIALTEPVVALIKSVAAIIESVVAIDKSAVNSGYGHQVCGRNLRLWSVVAIIKFVVAII